MLTLKQIIGAITNMLVAKFPNIPVVENDIQEGFKRPSFFIDIEGNSRNAELYATARNMTIRIYFFPSDRYIYSLEVLQMEDDLGSLFNLTIPIADRVITIDETTADMVDGVLQFEFDLNFRDSANNSNNGGSGELMQELTYREVE